MDMAVADDDFHVSGLPPAAVDAHGLAVFEAVQVAVLPGSGAGVGGGGGAVDALAEPSAQDEVVALPEEVLVELTWQ